MARQLRIGKRKFRLSSWNRFRGNTRWETWPIFDEGHAYNLTVALRPNQHSWLNWQWTLEVYWR